MPPPRFRFTLGQMMGLVAAVAVALALIPTPVGHLGTLCLAFAGVVAALAAATGMTRVRAAAWVGAGYPFAVAGAALALVAAEDRLGDLPDRLIWPLGMGGFLALGLTIGCLIAEAVRLTRGGRDRTATLTPLLVFAMLAWPAVTVLALLLAGLRVVLKSR